MLKKLVISCLGLIFLASSALAEKKEYTGLVQEIENAGGYSYIKLKENNQEFWVAVMKTETKIGTKITVKEQVWMNNFKSKALNKTFDKILFADLKGQKSKAVMHGMDIHGAHGQNKKKPEPEFNRGLVISKAKAIKTTIEDIYKDTAKYKNNNVEIAAVVTQVSNKVMGNTWVKVKDNNSSIIFRSSNEDENVKVGDKVKIVGTINTDVDYGFGFKYEIIGVNATFTKI